MSLAHTVRKSADTSKWTEAHPPHVNVCLTVFAEHVCNKLTECVLVITSERFQSSH